MNYFNKAIDILKQQDPEIATVKGLSGLLSSVRASQFPKLSKKRLLRLNRPLLEMLAGMEPDPVNKEVLTRIYADPKGWVLDAPECVQEGADWIQGIGKFINPEALEGVMLYHTIRDNVAELQESLGLGSCVGMKTVRVLAGSCTVHDFDGQLAESADDAALKKADAPKVIRLFLEQVIASGKYKMFEDFEEVGQPCEVGAVYQAGLTAVETWTHSDSHDWVLDESGKRWSSKGCDRDPILDADEILIHITASNGVQRYFKAVHTDTSRFPWMS